MLFLRYKQVPRKAASWERGLICLDLFAFGALVLASLSLMRSQIKNGSVCVVIAFRITKTMEQRLCIKFCQNVGETCIEHTV